MLSRRRVDSMLTAGSGLTPVMSMIRTLVPRRPDADVVMVHSARTREDALFHDELLELADQFPGLVVKHWYTREGAAPAGAGEAHGRRLDLETTTDLESLCPDWRDRETWACGPTPMLDAVEAHFEEAGLAERLHTERFSLELGGDGGEGGTLSFQNSGKQTEVDGATTVLEAGEAAGVGMPYGCRMGICHTCTVTKISGTVRDLRNGDEYDQPNEQVQTCVTVPVGPCVLNI